MYIFVAILKPTDNNYSVGFSYYHIFKITKLKIYMVTFQ